MFKLGLILFKCFVFAQHYRNVRIRSLGRIILVVGGVDQDSLQEHHCNDVLHAVIVIGGVEKVISFVIDDHSKSVGSYFNLFHVISGIEAMVAHPPTELPC